MPAAIIVEPVTRYLTMELHGEETTADRVFDSMAQARRDGLRQACMRGTVTVTIIGADGALLSSYQRADNIWRDPCRGTATVTTQEQSCTCGGTPAASTKGQGGRKDPTLGWLWMCSRCGAGAWSQIDPPAVNHG